MSIKEEDLKYIYDSLTEKEKMKFRNSKIFVTGCAGFLGYYIMNFLYKYFEELKIKKVIGVDNFLMGEPKWISRIKSNDIKIEQFDIITDELSKIEYADEFDLIIHMASIASPTFYRKYPIETLDANVWGLRKILDFYKEKNIKGLLFFSSSEIYGNPDQGNVPTSEEYNGSVSPIGPRACYDEAKRFGETLCYLFSRQYNMPIGIARPFNNYGPGMKLDDKRVVADFAKSIYENKDIVILSDGTPTRTFCYITDAIVGYFKILAYGRYDYFNIGMAEPEISMIQLAKIYEEAGKEVFNYTGKVSFENSNDKEYLTNNPQRRCPNINKAKEILNYNPKISVQKGVKRFLDFIKENKGEF